MPVMPACGKSRSGPVRRLCTAYDFPRCHFEIFPVCQASRLSTEVQERPQIRLPGIENLPVSTVKVCRTVTPRSRAFLGSLHRDRSPVLIPLQRRAGRALAGWPVPHINRK